MIRGERLAAGVNPTLRPKCFQQRWRIAENAFSIGVSQASRNLNNGWGQLNDVIGVAGGQLIFSADSQHGSGHDLWRTTDSAVGVEQLLTDKPSLLITSELEGFDPFDGSVYFTMSERTRAEQQAEFDRCWDAGGHPNDCEFDPTETLWRTDGTPAGTFEVAPEEHLAKVFEHVRANRSDRVTDSVGSTLFLRSRSQLLRWDKGQTAPVRVELPEAASYPHVRSSGIYYENEQHPDQPGVWRIDLDDGTHHPVPGLTGAQLIHPQNGLGSLKDQSLVSYFVHEEWSFYVTDGQTTTKMRPPEPYAGANASNIDNWLALDARRLERPEFTLDSSTFVDSLSLTATAEQARLASTDDLIFSFESAEAKLDVREYLGEIELDLSTLTIGPTKRIELLSNAQSMIRFTGHVDEIRFHLVANGVLVQTAGIELMIASDGHRMVDETSATRTFVRSGPNADHVTLSGSDTLDLSISNSEQSLELKLAGSARSLLTVNSGTGADHVVVEESFLSAIEQVPSLEVKLTEPVNGEGRTTFEIPAATDLEPVSRSMLRVVSSTNASIGIQVENRNRPRTNPFDPFDANADRKVSARDALHIINRLATESIDSAVGSYADVSGDGQLSPMDALLVINRLASGSDVRGGAEGEFLFGSVAWVWDTDDHEAVDQAFALF